MPSLYNRVAGKISTASPAQSLYAAGASLCFINTYWAIATILNYAIAPRFCWGLFSKFRAKESLSQAK